MENSLELVLWCSACEAFVGDFDDIQRQCWLNVSIVQIHTDDKKCVCTSSDVVEQRNVTVSKSSTSDKLYDLYVSEDMAPKENSR